MITKILLILLVITTMLVTFHWVKALVSFPFDDNRSIHCHNCHCGFCMEEPGTKECNKARAEHGLPEKIVEGEVQ